MDVDDSPDEAALRTRVRSLPADYADELRSQGRAERLLDDEAEHLDPVAQLAVAGAPGG